MSTDWGVGCVDCWKVHAFQSGNLARYFSGEWNNCRTSDANAIRKLIDAREEVIAVADKLGPLVEFFWGDAGSSSCSGPLRAYVVDFFQEHRGHKLRPMDEYGRFEQQCYKDVDCERCSGRSQCVLEAEHDGHCMSIKSALKTSGSVIRF